jgi:hypothetical protein
VTCLASCPALTDAACFTNVFAASGFYDIVTRKEAERRAELRAKMDELKAHKLTDAALARDAIAKALYK